MQIVWTAAALRDLAAIREFIAADNPRAADGKFS
jgi:plasmid stabilization system protein ParE